MLTAENENLRKAVMVRNKEIQAYVKSQSGFVP